MLGIQLKQTVEDMEPVKRVIFMVAVCMHREREKGIVVTKGVWQCM